jgi:hypothetical protein
MKTVILIQMTKAVRLLEEENYNDKCLNPMREIIKSLRQELNVERVKTAGTEEIIYKRLYKNFEDFLMMKHADQFIGLKDAMIDDFPNWADDLDLDQWIALGDQYLKEQTKGG